MSNEAENLDLSRLAGTLRRLSESDTTRPPLAVYLSHSDYGRVVRQLHEQVYFDPERTEPVVLSKIRRVCVLGVNVMPSRFVLDGRPFYDYGYGRG